MLTESLSGEQISINFPRGYFGSIAVKTFIPFDPVIPFKKNHSLRKKVKEAQIRIFILIIYSKFLAKLQGSQTFKL